MVAIRHKLKVTISFGCETGALSLIINKAREWHRHCWCWDDDDEVKSQESWGLVPRQLQTPGDQLSPLTWLLGPGPGHLSVVSWSSHSEHVITPRSAWWSSQKKGLNLEMIKNNVKVIFWLRQELKVSHCVSICSAQVCQRTVPVRRSQVSLSSLILRPRTGEA